MLLQQDLRGIALVKPYIMTALLGEIIPSLRAVTVDVKENKIIITSYYDGIISEDLIEDVSCMETEVMAAFFPEYQIEWKAVRCDFPTKIELNDAYYVMKRKE